jgi:hypothetical protein
MMPKDPKYPVSGHTEIDDAADTLSPHTYRYKSPMDEPAQTPNGGRYAGIIAQNLLKHPLTSQAVLKTPKGLAIDQKPMLSLLAATSGRAHDRLNVHEMDIGHIKGLLSATNAHLHHMKQKVDQQEVMLNKLHQIISRKVR